MERDPVVDAYLAGVPPARQAVLSEIRDACVEHLDGFDEVVAYGMPGYERDGQVEAGFASQKQYISVYILRTEVMEAHRDRLASIDTGKGCLRWRKPEDVDLDVIASMLRATAVATGPVC